MVSYDRSTSGRRKNPSLESAACSHRLPDKPDHDALERAILELWEREGTFARLRELNADGPRFSFVDGPVTANRLVLGVHTAWGRTLKDVFQRYKALRGHHQRYQNGFDCQGLWIEVGVERELGLNSKREIEEYGLAEFARRCREVVVKSSEALTEGSIRLGQWMDWGNDYFTFSDTNIEYIWRFLRVVDERGWLYLGHRSTEWCPRCGTSISAHELARHYEERVDPSLYVRFPLLDRHGEAIVVWTTTPWTLPANVAAAVHPEAEYGRTRERRLGRRGAAPRRALRRAAARIGARRAGATEGPFDALGPGADVEHRVIPWDEVALDTGTGIVHIAPGCGAEDFELSRAHALDVLTPVDETRSLLPRVRLAARPLHGGGGRPDRSAISTSAGCSPMRGTITHSYPFCWRCHTPLIFRLSDDWFIAVEELRPQLLARTRRWSGRPRTWASAWTTGSATWATGTSPGAATTGCRCRSTRAGCGHLNVIGSREELERAGDGAGSTSSRSCGGPWIDDVRSAARPAARRSSASPRSATSGSTPGSCPFSTLGWESPEYVPEGYATGAAKGLTTRRPARPRELGAVVPRRLGLGDARADPALVLLAALHVGRAVGPRAVPEGARLREDARRARAARCTARGATRSTPRMRSRGWAPT